MHGNILYITDDPSPGLHSSLKARFAVLLLVYFIVYKLLESCSFLRLNVDDVCSDFFTCDQQVTCMYLEPCVPL